MKLLKRKLNIILWGVGLLGLGLCIYGYLRPCHAYICFNEFNIILGGLWTLIYGASIFLTRKINNPILRILGCAIPSMALSGIGMYAFIIYG